MRIWPPGLGHVLISWRHPEVRWVCIWVHSNAWRMLVWSEISLHKQMRHPGRSGHARLNAQNDAFKTGDTVALKTIKPNLNQAVRFTKCTYGEKVQALFKHPTSTRRLWQGHLRKTSAFSTIWKIELHSSHKWKNPLGRFKAKKQQQKKSKLSS